MQRAKVHAQGSSQRASKARGLMGTDGDGRDLSQASEKGAT